MGKSKKKKKSLSGLRLAAAYGAAPNRLGFCGPQGKNNCQKISRYLTDKANDLEIRHILEKFEAAYSYLELIARKNKIKDPFDLRVVEAFWIGNARLEKVTGADIKKMVLKEFTKPGLLSRHEAEKRIKAIPKNSLPHHSFHVYILGPITGRISLNDIELKDICRVGWGKVINFKVPASPAGRQGLKSKVIVKYKPIIRGYKFGRAREKELNWDKRAVLQVKIGDWVSFHWNILCQKLSSSNVLNLEKYTKHTLESANLGYAKCLLK